MFADRDPLTGALSRSSFERQFEQQRLTTRQDGSAVLIFVDLEGVFAINHTHGFAAGDEMLRQVATILLRKVGDGGWVGRVGGCQFLLLIPNMPQELGIQVARDLASTIGDFRLVWQGAALRVAVWIGVLGLEHDWPNFATARLATSAARRRAQVTGCPVHVSSDRELQNAADIVAST
jgi:diguanylate cyclase (GGDEF)-like protein